MHNIHTPKTPDFESLLQEMNETLFNAEMEDLVEVTYAYATLDDGKMLNKTLFGKFLGVEYKGLPGESSEDKKQNEKTFWKNISQNLHQVLAQTKAKLLQKKNLIIKYKQALLPYLKEKNPRVEILMGTLDFTSKIIDLTLIGLPFEAEKAGISHNLTQEQVEERIQKLEQIEGEIFGGNVRENNYEVQGSYDFMKHLFLKQKERLTGEEQKQFQEYLTLLVSRFPYIDTQKEKKVMKNTPIESYDFFNTDISRNDYITIFKIVFSLYGIKKPVIMEERSSIYDGVEALVIPDTPAYDTLKLKRVLALIQHEIETHYIIEQNNSQTLGKFRGAKNLQREEGLAMISESILLGKTLDDVQVGLQIPDTLMGEILDGQDYERFMILLTKLQQGKNAKGNYQRRKRNYPLHFRGVQHKDTSYNRGQHKVVEYLKNGGDVKDLYVGKVSFEDISRMKDISQMKNIQLIYPLLIGEILAYILSGRKLVEKEFFPYIEKKYPFLNIANELGNKSIERFTKEIKIRIVGILELCKSSDTPSLYPRMLKKFHKNQTNIV